MFKAVITTVVMALSEKQKNCSSDKTTTVCGDSSESLQLPTKPHSRGCESTYNKVLFTPPTMCRLTLKASIEYENDSFQHLGSVVTNHGYSDWATTVIDASVKTMWYRLSRREDDYCIECSKDGLHFEQMRVCHLHEGNGRIQFGIYACSPEKSSFKAVFSNMELMECQWKAHNGQQPDTES